MGRPIKDGWDYFPLDTNFDNKVRALEAVFKNDGFVWIIKFWQDAYSNNAGEVNLGGYRGIIHAENCRVTTEQQDKIIKLCLEIGLIYKISDDIYSSNGISKRIQHLISERERWRSKGKREVPTALSSEKTPEIRGESKVKGSKEKKSITVFKPPTIEEVAEYCKERKNGIDASSFIDFYQARGWTYGRGVKVKDWKACMRTWEHRRKSQDPQKPEESTGALKTLSEYARRKKDGYKGTYEDFTKEAPGDA